MSMVAIKTGRRPTFPLPGGSGTLFFNTLRSQWIIRPSVDTFLQLKELPSVGADQQCSDVTKHRTHTHTHTHTNYLPSAPYILVFYHGSLSLMVLALWRRICTSFLHFWSQANFDCIIEFGCDQKVKKYNRTKPSSSNRKCFLFCIPLWNAPVKKLRPLWASVCFSRECVQRKWRSRWVSDLFRIAIITFTQLKKASPRGGLLINRFAMKRIQ